METAYRTKEVVSVTATDSHDRGNKTMLEHFLYINVVRNTTFMVAIFGLFPKPSQQMDKYSPQMTIAHKYLTLQDKSQQHSFNAILDSMIAQKTFSEIPSRALRRVTFDPSKHVVSLIPVMAMLFLRNLSDIDTENLAQHPILHRNSTYAGGKDITLIGSEHESSTFRVSQMRELSLIDQNMPPKMLKILTVAKCLFFWDDRDMITSLVFKKLEDEVKLWTEATEDTNNFCILNVNVNVDAAPTPVPTPKRKARSKSNTPVRKKNKQEDSSTSTDPTEIRQSLGRLVEQVINLGETMPAESAHLMASIKESILDLTRLSCLGTHTDLTSLQTELASNSSRQDSTSMNNSPLTKEHILAEIDSNKLVKGKLVYRDVTEENVKNSHGWSHNMELNMSDSDVQNKFIVFEMKNALVVHKFYTDDTTQKGAAWCREVSKLMKRWRGLGWKPSLESVLPKSKSGTLTLITLMTLPEFESQNELILIDRENKVIYDGSSSDDDAY